MRDPLDEIAALGDELAPLFETVAKARQGTVLSARVCPAVRAISRVMIGNTAYAKASDIVAAIRAQRARHEMRRQATALSRLARRRGRASDEVRSA